MEKILIINTIPESDVSGSILFNSDFPYDNILSRPQIVGNTGDTGLNGSEQVLPLSYDFSLYPPANDSSTASYTGLVPDSSNVILYTDAGGITYTNYLLTTSNHRYPILISDNYIRWAAPVGSLNPFMVYTANGSYRDYKNNQWVVYGEGGVTYSNISPETTMTYSNFITSNNGLTWSGIKYNNPYLSNITGYVVDSVSDIGIAVGEGSTSSISILAGSPGNNQMWLPIINSNSLISQPTGVVRGPSWIVYGNKGSGSNSLCESNNGLEWAGVTAITEDSIVSVDVNQFTNVCMASSGSKLFIRDSDTGIWTSHAVNDILDVQTTITSITNVAVGSEYSVQGSVGTWLAKVYDNFGTLSFWTSIDDGKNWTVDTTSGLSTSILNYTNLAIGSDSSMDYQDWQFFGNDLNDQLNIIELSVTGTNGELASYSYGVVDLQGLTGLNVTSYGSIHNKSLEGITYTSYLNQIGLTFSSASIDEGFTNLEINDITGIVDLGLTGQEFSTISGAIPYQSEDVYSSFTLSFNTDKYSSKEFVFNDGYYNYNFTINDYANASVTGGSIYSFSTESGQKGSTSAYIANIYDGLVFSQNILFADMYQSQITNLNLFINEITSLIDVLGSTSGLFKEFASSNYNNNFLNGITGSEELQKFYTPIQLTQNQNVGSYNFDSFTQLESLVGYPISSTLLNLKDLYNQINLNSKNTKNFQEILQKFRTLEYFLSYDSQIFNTIQNAITTNTKIPVLISLLTIINDSLTNNKNQAFQTLNSSKVLNELTNDQLNYSSNSIFEFTFDGQFLKFSKDNIQIQQYTIYNNNKLSFDISLNPELRKTTEIIDQSVASISNFVFHYNIKSGLYNTIENAFEKKQSELDYIDQMKYIALIPDTDLTDLRVQDIFNIPSLYPLLYNIGTTGNCLAHAYQLDTQIIPKNYYYALSKFITEPTLLSLVGTLMTNNSSNSPTFNYFDVHDYSNQSGIQILPSSTGLGTYQNLFIRDPSSGYWRITSLLITVYQGLITDFGNVLSYDRNYPNAVVPMRQMSIDTFRERFANEDLIQGTPSGTIQDYKNVFNLIISELWNFSYFYNLRANTNIYNNLITNTYDNTPVTGLFNNLPNRKYVFDYLYNDLNATINGSAELNAAAREGIIFPALAGINILANNNFNNEFKCTTGTIFNLLLSDGITGNTAMSDYLSSAYQIGQLVNGITANNTQLSTSIARSVYQSFFTDVLEYAGVTALQETLNIQNKSDYVLLKRYLDQALEKSMIEGTTASYLTMDYNDSVTGVSGLTDVNNQFLSIINTARTYGCTAITNINEYNNILQVYQGLTFTSSITYDQLYSNLPSIYLNTFVPLLKTILLNKFQLDPTNRNFYLSSQQDRLFKRYLNFTDGLASSDYNAIKLSSYVVNTTRYVDVNAIYYLFAQDTYTSLETLVNNVFGSSDGTNLNDDLALVRQIIDGTEPNLQAYSRTIGNLNRQSQYYISLISDINIRINAQNLLLDIKDGYERFNNMATAITSNAPPTAESNTDSNENFIMNVPPFDTTYWQAGSTGVTGPNFYPKYNPNYRYYKGDWIIFDNYGTTGPSIYQCISTKRYGNIKGVSPGTLGPTGTLSSLLCWKEFHDVPEPNINFPPQPVGKYDEFNYTELNYNLIGPTGQQLAYATQEYSSTEIYVEGDIVLYNNAPFICQGSVNIYKDVGKGIPPGFNDNFDKYWKVLGIAGAQLYEYPAANGIWFRDPDLNQEFVDFQTLYNIDDLITTRNSQNKFITQDYYDENKTYNVGDLVLYADNFGNEYIYTCQGSDIYGIAPPSVTTIAGDILWRAYPYINASTLPQFSITQTYNVGQLVKHNNVAYKFVFDNAAVPNFQVGNTGIGYKYLDVVEYGGYLFSSKINENISEPLVPVDFGASGASGANFTRQDLLESRYWDYVSGLTGYTGTLPPKFNFMHDYCSDYHILKIQPLLVIFANSVWKWKYNPLGIDYTVPQIQYFKNLSCIQNIAPPLPEPLNLWVQNTAVTGATAYNDSTSYNKDDIVMYNNFYFQATGYGFGTVVINEDGDESELFPYSPDITLSYGTLSANQYGRYADTRISVGNDKDNYAGFDPATGIAHYGTPKWGSGVLFDVWSSSGFGKNLRKFFADNIELTYNTLIHNIKHLLTSSNITVPTGPVLALMKPYYTTLTSNGTIVPILSDLGVSSFGTSRNIYNMNLTVPPSAGNGFAIIEEKFNNVQFYYYSGLIKQLQSYQNTLQMLNTNLNTLKNLWKKLNEKLFEEIYESYYLLDRYYPGIDGVPLLTKDMLLESPPTLGKVFIKKDDFNNSIRNYNSLIGNIGNSQIQSNLFSPLTSFTDYGFNGFTGGYPSTLDNGNIGWGAYYNNSSGAYQGVSGTTASANGIFINPNYFAGITGGLFPLALLSPTYAVLNSQYETINSDISYYTNAIGELVGLPLLKKMRDGSYMTSDGHLSNKMYENGCAVYSGTDVPIFVPIITNNDIDTLSLSFGSNDSSTFWFNMPGGVSGMPCANLGNLPKSNNIGLAEKYNFDIFPNRYQFQDVKNTLNTIYNATSSQILNSTGLQTTIRNNVITTRLQLENNNNIPKTGTFISDNRQIGWSESGTLSYSGGGGVAGFASNTQFVLYQPYGAFNSHERSYTQHGDQDGNDDRTRGYGSHSGFRSFNGERYDDEPNNMTPMQYDRPNLVALTDEQLFSSQGKHDITLNKRFRSILPYLFFVQQIGDIEPAYTKVTDPETIWKNIKIEARRQESENVKNKFTQILLVIVMAYLVILAAVVSVVGTVFSGGALAVALGPMWIGIATAFTTLTAVVAVTGAILTAAGQIQIGRSFSMFFTNPVGAFLNPPISSTNLFARCAMLSNTLNTQTDENPDVLPTVQLNRVTYAEYKYAQYYSDLIVNTFYPQALQTYNPYYIDGYQGNIESLSRCGRITLAQRAQMYLGGLTGTTGYTSLDTYIDDYTANTIGVRYGTPVTKPTGTTTTTLETLNNLENSLIICYNKIALYETCLAYPRYQRIDFTQYPRSAKIQIKNIQYGGSVVDKDFPDSYSGSRIYAAGKQLYANFKIIDPGEGYYEDDGLGKNIGIYKPLGTLSIPSIENSGLSLQMDFVIIKGGYCNEGNTGNISYFGINTFDTSETKDYNKMPFTFTGDSVQNVISALENKTFYIRHELVGLAPIGNMPHPVVNTSGLGRFRGAGAAPPIIANAARPPSFAGPVQPQPGPVTQIANPKPIAGQIPVRTINNPPPQLLPKPPRILLPKPTVPKPPTTGVPKLPGPIVEPPPAGKLPIGKGVLRWTPGPSGFIGRMLGPIGAIVAVAMAIKGAVDAIQEINSQQPYKETC